LSRGEDVNEGDMAFDVEEYANAQHCTLTRKTMLFNQVTTYWRGPEQGRIACTLWS